MSGSKTVSEFGAVDTAEMMPGAEVRPFIHVSVKWSIVHALN